MIQTISLTGLFLSYFFLVLAYFTSKREARVTISSLFASLFWIIAILEMVYVSANSTLKYSLIIAGSYFPVYLLVSVKATELVTWRKGKSNGEQKQSPKEEPQQSPDINKSCCATLINKLNGQIVKNKKGKFGSIGWVFFVSSYYEWDLRINAWTSNVGSGSITIYAASSAKGFYSGNFGFKNIPIDLQSSVQVTVSCRKVGERCEAFTSDNSEDEDADYGFKVAASIKSTQGGNKDEASVTATMVACVEGKGTSKIKIPLKVLEVDVDGSRPGWPFVKRTHAFKFVCHPCNSHTF
mgnify:CR=1 FL=1